MGNSNSLSRIAGLPTWDRPAAACLSSRIPYGTPVTIQNIRTVEVGEEELKALEIPVSVIVGENDSVRKWYVEPLHHVRPDWQVRVIPGAEHLNCAGKPEFKSQLEAALLKPQT